MQSGDHRVVAGAVPTSQPAPVLGGPECARRVTGHGYPDRWCPLSISTTLNTHSRAPTPLPVVVWIYSSAPNKTDATRPPAAGLMVWRRVVVLGRHANNADRPRRGTASTSSTASTAGRQTAADTCVTGCSCPRTQLPRLLYSVIRHAYMYDIYGVGDVDLWSGYLCTRIKKNHTLSWKSRLECWKAFYIFHENANTVRHILFGASAPTSANASASTSVSHGRAGSTCYAFARWGVGGT